MVQLLLESTADFEFESNSDYLPRSVGSKDSYPAQSPTNDCLPRSLKAKNLTVVQLFDQNEIPDIEVGYGQLDSGKFATHRFPAGFQRVTAVPHLAGSLQKILLPQQSGCDN